MTEKLEIKLGLERKGLLGRKVFTIETPSRRDNCPSLAEAANAVSTFLMHYSDPRREYELTTTEELGSHLQPYGAANSDEHSIMDVLRDLLALYNRQTALYNELSPGEE